MIGLRRYMQEGGGSPEINIAPLIDMVFILLIFFLVTTSFVREAGIDVDRPTASTAKQVDKDAIQVAISKNGDVFIDGSKVSLLSLRSIVRDRLRNRDLPVVIISDQATRTRSLVEVMDECKVAGAKQISIAAREE